MSSESTSTLTSATQASSPIQLVNPRWKRKSPSVIDVSEAEDAAEEVAQEDAEEPSPAKKCMTQLRELVMLRKEHTELQEQFADLQKQQEEAKKREEEAKKREEEAKKREEERQELAKLQARYEQEHDGIHKWLTESQWAHNAAIQCMTTHKNHGEYWLFCATNDTHYLVVTNYRVFRFQQIDRQWRIMQLYVFHQSLTIPQLHILHTGRCLANVCDRLLKSLDNPLTVDAMRFQALIRLIPGSYVPHHEGWVQLGGFFGIYQHTATQQLSTYPDGVEFKLPHGLLTRNVFASA